MGILISSCGSCCWLSDKDYTKPITTFIFWSKFRFRSKLATLGKPGSCTVCVHITAELVPRILFVSVFQTKLLLGLPGLNFSLFGYFVDRLDNLSSPHTHFHQSHIHYFTLSLSAWEKYVAAENISVPRTRINLWIAVLERCCKAGRFKYNKAYILEFSFFGLKGGGLIFDFDKIRWVISFFQAGFQLRTTNNDS